jgi:hypothetical protein
MAVEQAAAVAHGREDARALCSLTAGERVNE